MSNKEQSDNNLTCNYTVYILSRNRPGMLAEAIHGVLKAGCPPQRIFISDNSTNESVRALQSEFPEVNFIFRRPPLPLLEHFNTLIRSAQAEYFFMLHDDDVVSENFISDSLALISKYPDVGAASLNALIMEGDRQTDHFFCRNDFDERLITDGRTLLYTYFSEIRAFTPFPAYIYRTSKISSCKAIMEGAGPYSDIAFLFTIAMRFGIAQSAKPGMFYRVHPEQGSTVPSANRTKEILMWAKKRGVDIMEDFHVKRSRLKIISLACKARGNKKTYNRIHRNLILHILSNPPYVFRRLGRLIKQKTLSLYHK